MTYMYPNNHHCGAKRLSCTLWTFVEFMDIISAFPAAMWLALNINLSNFIGFYVRKLYTRIWLVYNHNGINMIGLWVWNPGVLIVTAFILLARVSPPGWIAWLMPAHTEVLCCQCWTFSHVIQYSWPMAFVWWWFSVWFLCLMNACNKSEHMKMLLLACGNFSD